MASASCVVTAGATPVFADVDRNSGNVTADTIAAVLTPRTKAIIPVHLAGWPCDMDAIVALADARGIAVIEDCAQAHGARYKGRSVGTFGDIGAWSFCQDKIITAGEGGMVTTDDEALWNRMWSYKDHGKSYDVVYNRKHEPGYRWVHESFGTNWRMLEMQATIGRIQLRLMSEWHDARVKHANALLTGLRDTPGLRIPTLSSDAEHAWYRFYVFVEAPTSWRMGGIGIASCFSDQRAKGPVHRRELLRGSSRKAFDRNASRPCPRLPKACA